MDTIEQQQQNTTTKLWVSTILLDQVQIGQRAVDLVKKTAEKKAV
jgi:hypothetical protein